MTTVQKSERNPFREGNEVGYEMGQWATLNRILNYLNTLEDREVDKVRLYHEIFEWRPQSKDLEKAHI
jgi:hypothetical protein